MKKYIFNLLTAVAVVMVLASPMAGKDITQSVPAIYDKAIAEAQKQNAIVDTIDVMSTKMGRVIRNTVVLPAQSCTCCMGPREVIATGPRRPTCAHLPHNML